MLVCFMACFMTAMAQISGTVVSANDGDPISGATVKVKGASLGTVTDVNGNFSIKTEAGKTLVVSYIGMETKEVKAKNGMRIQLAEDENLLDDIIVTGYGNFKKSSFTGAASNVNTAALEDVPVTSIEDKLAGAVPGVSISSNSGNPGAVAVIRVRGMGSLNAGNQPLVVVDGTPIADGNMDEFSGNYSDAGTSILASLNSNDIESLTVIKDAAAASLYGSRAANGVIVITTKSGKQGKTHVDFKADLGYSDMAINYRPQLSGQQRRDLLQLGLKNFGINQMGMGAEDAAAFAEENIDDFAPIPEMGWANWKKALFRTGVHKNYQASVSGGSDNTKFYVSAAYTDQEGIIKNQGMERTTFNANLSHHFGRFDVNYTSQLSMMNQDVTFEGTSYDGAIANYCFFQHPSEGPYNEDGSLSEGSGFTGMNPLYEWEHSYDKNKLVRIYNTLKLSYNIWDNLYISEKVAFDYTENNSDVLWDRFSNNGGPDGVMQRMINRQKQLNTQTQLTYNKTFGGHNVDALVGFETEDYNYVYNYMSGMGFPGNLYELTNAGDTDSASNQQDDRLTSFLGRVNYNYVDKYYAGVSLRTDGSSRLAKDNRWGTFWSVSGAWRFTAEEFLKNDILTDGKVRLSYGVNGTRPGSLYAYRNQYTYGTIYNGQSGMAIIGISNPDLKWEKNKTWNLGLDLQFLNRFNLTVDYYQRRTTDLIYSLPVSMTPGYISSSSGGHTTPQNIGSMENKGIEVTLNANIFKTKDFQWDASLNFGHNSNKLTKIDGEQDEIVDGPLIHRVGEAYYSYYMYEYAGVDPETGSELYYINGDGDDARETTTDASMANKTIVGKHEPAIEGGFATSLRWKFIDFNMNWAFSVGGDAFDYATWQHSNGGSYLYYGATPAYYDVDKMWKQPGDIASQPRFEYGNSTVSSSRWLMPTDYLRLKSVTVGFSAPKEWLKKINISRARVFFSASNLLTVKSKTLFVDPEMPVDGCCTFETPALRTYTFGIDLSF